MNSLRRRRRGCTGGIYRSVVVYSSLVVQQRNMSDSRVFGRGVSSCGPGDTICRWLGGVLTTSGGVGVIDQGSLGAVDRNGRRFDQVL